MAVVYDWGPDVLKSVAQTSIEAAFCDDDTRTTILAALESWSPEIA